MLKLRDFAKSRMKRFGLSEDDVKSIIGTQSDGTGVHRYVGVLSDGRTGKVRVVNGVVADAFILH